MVQAAQRTPTTPDRLRRSIDRETDLYGLIRSQQRSTAQIVSPIFGQSAGSSATIGTGGFLKTAGDTMVGPIAFFPTIVTIATGEIDIGRQSGDFTSYVFCTPESGSTDDLVTITGAVHAGQLLYLQGIATDTITIKNSGNIETLDGNDYDLIDDDIIILIFDITDNKWQQITSGKNSLGANKQLSNLSGTVAVNVDLDPGGAGGIRDMGNATQFWDAIFLERIRFPDTQALAAGSEVTIGYDTGLAPDAAFWNVPSGNDILLKFDAVTGFTFNAAGLIVVGTAGVTAEEFFVNTAGADPTLNGEIVRNVADVKVFSGGAVRNFSDISTSPSANQQLSNLSGTVAVNVDLDPGGAGGTRDIGNPTQFWDAIYLERIRFPDTQALAAGSEVTIGWDTGLAPDAAFWNVPSGNDILLKFDAVTGFTFNAAGLIVVGTSGVTAEEFFVNTAGADPTLNGEIVRNVADVKVFSGSAVRNFTQMAYLL